MNRLLSLQNLQIFEYVEYKADPEIQEIMQMKDVNPNANNNNDDNNNDNNNNNANPQVQPSLPCPSQAQSSSLPSLQLQDLSWRQRYKRAQECYALFNHSPEDWEKYWYQQVVPCHTSLRLQTNQDFSHANPTSVVQYLHHERKRLDPNQLAWYISMNSRERNARFDDGIDGDDGTDGYRVEQASHLIP